MRGPLGAPVPAALLLADDGAARTAYVEAAQACGLHLCPPGTRAGPGDDGGVGTLLAAARDAGATRVVVGLGGSGTNDAGAGMLAELLVGAGADPADPLVTRLVGGGDALRGLVAADLGPLAAVRRAWAEVGLVVASDLDIGLLGFHGASPGHAAAKGATPEQAQALERCLGDFAAAATAALGLDAKITAVPGAGADGGLGFALLLLGATRVPGAAAVADAVGLAGRVRAADLVVTGEGCFDWQSLRGTVVAGVARAALDVGTPAVVVAGQVSSGAARRRRSASSPPTRWPGRPPRSGAMAEPWATPWPARSGSRDLVPSTATRSSAAGVPDRSGGPGPARRRAGRWHVPWTGMQRAGRALSPSTGARGARRERELPRPEENDPMTVQDPTAQATQEQATKEHGVQLTDAAASKVEPARAGGSRRPRPAHRRPAGWLLRPALPALLRRALARRRRRRGLRRRAGRRRPDERAVPRRRRPSTSSTRSRSRASPSTTRTPAAPAPAATPSTERSRSRQKPRTRRRALLHAAGAPRVAVGSARQDGRVRIAITGSIATDHLMTFPGRFADSLVAGQAPQGVAVVPRRRPAGPARRHRARTSRSASAASACGRCWSARSATTSRVPAWLERHGVDCAVGA